MNKTVQVLYVAALVSLLLPRAASAQQPLLGISNSNYAGVHGLFLNPSSIADSRYKLYVNLFTVGASATNTYAGYNAPFSPWQLMMGKVPAQYKNADGSVDFKGTYIKENLNGKPKQGSLGFDFKGPSFMVRLNSKSSIGLTTRARQFVQVNHLSENFARLLKTGIDEDALLNKVNKDNQFNLNVNAFTEIGVSYARTLVEQQAHFLKGGLTVKRLAGMYSGHLINLGTTYQVTKNPNNPLQSVLKIDQLSAKFGYVDPDYFSNQSVGAGWLTGKNAPGAGWGFDLGFTYEFRPEEKKDELNKYKYRIGLAITDIGGITYNNQQYVRKYDILRQNVTIDPSKHSDVSSGDGMIDMLKEELKLGTEPYQTSIRSGLPTAMNLTFDYQVNKLFFLNVLWMQGLRGSESIAMRQNSLLAVTPRIETKWAEISIPLAFINSYHNFTIGTMVRVGPLMLGSDNIGGLFNMGSPYGSDVYAGLCVPLFKGKSKEPKLDTPAKPAKATKQAAKPKG
ncbi:MAG: DUF5723 family protein [Bacteroidota bacterium]